MTRNEFIIISENYLNAMESAMADIAFDGCLTHVGKAMAVARFEDANEHLSSLLKTVTDVSDKEEV